MEDAMNAVLLPEPDPLRRIAVKVYSAAPLTSMVFIRENRRFVEHRSA
jgi:hypothetical protein